jgi:asparagine synthase (glutamine-hydrolysing)
MVERLESDHHEVVVSKADIAGAFPDVVYHAERPVLRTAPAPLFRSRSSFTSRASRWW